MFSGDSSQPTEGNPVESNPITTTSVQKQKSVSKPKKKPTASKPTSGVSQKTSVVKTKKRKEIIPTSDSEDDIPLAQRLEKRARVKASIVSEALDTEVLDAEVPIVAEAHTSIPSASFDVSESQGGSYKEPLSSTHVTHTHEQQQQSPIHQTIEDVLREAELMDSSTDDEEPKRKRKTVVSSSEDSVAGDDDDDDDQDDDFDHGAGGEHMEDVGVSGQQVDTEEQVAFSGDEIAIGEYMEDEVMASHAVSTGAVTYEVENPNEAVARVEPSAGDTSGAATQALEQAKGESQVPTVDSTQVDEAGPESTTMVMTEGAMEAIVVSARPEEGPTANFQSSGTPFLLDSGNLSSNPTSVELGNIHTQLQNILTTLSQIQNNERLAPVQAKGEVVSEALIDRINECVDAQLHRVFTSYLGDQPQMVRERLGQPSSSNAQDDNTTSLLQQILQSQKKTEAHLQGIDAEIILLNKRLDNMDIQNEEREAKMDSIIEAQQILQSNNQMISEMLTDITASNDANKGER